MERGMFCAVLPLVALAAVGCGDARYVHKDANGGVVAMRGDTSANRKKAEELITAHVGAGYQIVEEKEVITGQETTDHVNTQTEPTVHSKIPILPAQKQTTTTTTTTRDVTEWQITYRRGNNPPAATQPVQQTGGQLPAK
jgi:hypothetical protein